MNKTNDREAADIRLPASTMQHLSAASKVDLAFLIRLAAEEFPVDLKTRGAEFAADIGATREELERSLYFLRGAALITTDALGRISVGVSEPAPAKERKLLSADTPQRFTSGEIRRLTEENGALSSLFDDCQQAMGKLFTTDEFNIVISLSEYYAFAVLFSHRSAHHSPSCSFSASLRSSRMSMASWRPSHIPVSFPYVQPM